MMRGGMGGGGGGGGGGARGLTDASYLHNMSGDDAMAVLETRPVGTYLFRPR
jgi:hypothetical protein